MALEKSTRQNRVKEALGKIYDQQPPYFREYLRRYKDDPTSRVFAPLAEAYRRLGRVDEAIDLCLEGLGHHPDFHGGRVALAKCYMDKKLYTECRNELERVIQNVPENLLAQRLLGDAYVALGNLASGLQRFKMALMLSPDDVTLSEKIHYLERQVYQQPPTVPLQDSEPEAVEEKVSDPELTPIAQMENEVLAAEPVKEETALDIDQLLSSTGEAADEDAFQIQPVAQIFGAATGLRTPEITTETLADLYFSQGQFDRSLRIFEKLSERYPSAELTHKINSCRKKLGMQQEDIIVNQKIRLLRSILKNVREVSS